MWIYYVLLTIASVLFSLQFVFNKCYQRENGTSFQASLVFGGISALVSVPIFWIIGGFRFEYSGFSFLVALLYAIDCVVCTAFSVKALRCANLVVFSLFMMLGGMLLPLFYGLCVGEKMTLWKTVGVFAIFASMIVTLKKSENEPKLSKFAVFCFFAIFVSNGLVGVFTSWHQGNREQAISAAGFVLLCNIMKFVLSAMLLILLSVWKKTKKNADGGDEEKDFQDGEVLRKNRLKTLGVCCGYAVVNGIGNYFVTISAKYLAAVVQYPIITGGCIFFSAVFGILFGEKITKKTVIGLVLVLFGTVLSMF